MTMHAPVAAAGPGYDTAGRPMAHLPTRQLFQLSIYWFGINAIWGGLGGPILQERVILANPGIGGTLYAIMDTFAVIVAILVQPTIGSISDYTISRWGRRKPYIAIGAVLDVVFLVGIAYSQTYVSILVFLVLLQFSSNFAQGPFQGYIPDLVPAGQVGTASALVGLMSILGVVGGTALASIGYLFDPDDFSLPTIGLGIVELATAIGTLLWVREGRAAKERAGRPWTEIAREVWSTDILQERSFVWLVGSRLFILAAVSVLYKFNVVYLTDALRFSDAEKSFWVPLTSAVIAVMIGLSTFPAARLSDRVGRKRMIYLSCAGAALGMVILGVAGEILVAELGVAIVAVAAGSFLAVDWALMTDIIPKASSGRFMGISNVATASAGPVAAIFGGLIIDRVGSLVDPDAAIRVAFLVAIGFLALGAVLLRPVDSRRREEEAQPATAGA